MNKNEEMIEMREDIDYLINELEQLKKRVYDIESGDV